MRQVKARALKKMAMAVDRPKKVTVRQVYKSLKRQYLAGDREIRFQASVKVAG